jgi:HEAT repeat protein
MKTSWIGGLVVGLLIGVVATAVVTLLSRKDPKPKPPPPKLVAPAPDPEIVEENRLLRERVAELESKLARPAPPEAAPPEPPPAPEPASDLTAEFKALVAKGLGAFGQEDFKTFAERARSAGQKGLDFLQEILLNSESGTERFMAAAVLEQLKNPNAIPSLIKALQEDGDMIVRRMSSHALAIIGTEAAEAPLRAAMGVDTDWGVRVNSAYGLAKMGREDGQLYLERTYASEETPAEYRLAILGGLADVAAPSTAAFFRRVLNDSSDPTYQILSISALEKMKDTEAIVDLEKIAASDAPSFVKEAARKAVETIRR